MARATYRPEPRWRSERAVAFDAYVPSNLTGDVDLVFTIPSTNELAIKGRHLVLNPGAGNRNVDLPAVADSEGLELLISNPVAATNNLVVRSPGHVALATVLPGRSLLAFCDGVIWRATLFVTAVGGITDFGALGIKSDVVAESTAGAGVTVDGALIKDGRYRADNDTPAAPGFTWDTDDNLGFYRVGADRAGVAIGGVGGVTFSGPGVNSVSANDTAGLDFYLLAFSAGAAPTLQRNGGAFVIFPGDGANAPDGVPGGDGGALVLWAGLGGDTDSVGADNAGDGGDAALVGAAAGDQDGVASSGNGGSGGQVNLTGGLGGEVSDVGASGNAGPGGQILGNAGDGGPNAGTGDGGAGGNVTLLAGTGGTVVSGTPGASGIATIAGGPGADLAVAVACPAGGQATLAAGDGGDNSGGAAGQAGGAGGLAFVNGGDGGTTDSVGAHNGGNGGDALVLAGDGGAATAGTGNGGTGGTASIDGGDGAATTGGTAGAGGPAKVNGGDGAAQANAIAAGPGGAASLNGGLGGNNTGGAAGQVGGAGGNADALAGDGGDTNSVGVHNGGDGGDCNMTAGNGGNATAGTGDGGAGGDVLLTPGAGGTSAGGAAGADGLARSAGRFVTREDLGLVTDRIVGGVIHRVTVDEVLTDPAGAGAHNVDGTPCNLEADIITLGTVIEVEAEFEVTAAATAETVQLQLLLGATVIAQTVAAGAMVAANIAKLRAKLVGRAVPAGVAAVRHGGEALDLVAADTDTTIRLISGTTNFATNGALAITPRAAFGAVEAVGGNAVTLHDFTVKVTG